MTKHTKIVGHRGAAALELENTLPSFLKAKELAVDALELDVQATRDDQLVVFHDLTLKRVSKAADTRQIGELTYDELQQIPLHNGWTVPLLRDVLEAAGDTNVIIDIKIDHHIKELCALLDEFPGTHFTFVSGRRKALKQCKQYRPDILALSERHYSPVSFMSSVKRHNFDGLNMNYRWLNPITYKLAQKQGLQIMVYTVDNVHIAKWIKRLYPGVWICTNNPDKFIAALNNK